MGELTESARQNLVSQGIVIGIVSILTSLTLLLTGVVVIARAHDILQFTSLIHLAILQLVCSVLSVIVVAFVWWIIVGYRNRQLEIRSKYLDDNLTKGLLTLFIPLFLNYSAFLVSVVFLIVKTETTSRHEMKNSMSQYLSEIKEKVLIDRLQILLHCCGSQSIMDWFLIDWQGSDGDSGNHSRYNSSSDWDSVPFSCCNLETPPPCIHQRLRVFGVTSLYDSGCSDKLDKAVLIFVSLSLCMSFFISLTMSLLMYSARKLQTSARSAVDKGDATAPGHWWILSPSASIANTRKEEVPLLGSAEGTAKDEDRLSRIRRNQEFVYFQTSKIIDSTINEDWASYNSGSIGPEMESIEDWPVIINNGASQSTSTVSFDAGSIICNYSADSRRSVSDTAVANLEVSHHLEHKIRPVYRS